ncbi:MerR family transcriptional regulator [Xanthobacter sp. KR7-225]|uniref:MerR family transcriptional regulator n=1 Tax=Xanthobacter sp. KR7-225 TaxID=3156613 RepID=UPI0032B51DF5
MTIETSVHDLAGAHELTGLQPQRARPMEAERLHTIGELSRDFGTTLRALRFYEDKGLLNPKRDGTRRLYSDADRTRLALILKGKRLGFTLSELLSLVGAKDGKDRASLALTRERCVNQISVLERQRGEIDEAIGELKGMLHELSMS